jgi:glycerol-3-phosphate acyltransferase PlsY
MLRMVALAVAAYLLGSIPFGFVIARARGVDLRRVGSGNIGSTNIYRALGFGIALAVFALDAAKGLLATRAMPLAVPEAHRYAWAGLVLGLAVMLGSISSIFMRFRGGKGVATGAGVFLGLAPLATVICIGAWAGIVAVWKYVSLGSLAAAAALPILVAAFDGSDFARDPVFYLAIAVTVLVFARHRSNLRRLLAGTENKVGRSRVRAGTGEEREQNG